MRSSWAKRPSETVGGGACGPRRVAPEFTFVSGGMLATMKVARDTPILVVDENLGGLTVRSHLRQLGFGNVDVVGTGHGAMGRMDNARYGLVLSEWSLFDTEALLLLKAMRFTERHKHVPFIVVTSHREPKDVFAARQAGVNRYILKPYSLATLRHQLETVLGPITWGSPFL